MRRINKNNIKISLLIILLVTMTLGGTYAFLNYSGSSNTAQGTGGCFQVNYSGAIISDLNNNLVQSNNTGTSNEIATGAIANANSTVTLSKSTSCKIYTEARIYLHTSEETTAPIEGVPAFKYKITQGSNTIETGIVNKKGDFLLTTVPITDSALTYNIYFWIDSTVSGGAYNFTTFAGNIFAESSQTSTIENTHMLSFSATGSDKLPDRVVTLNQNYGTLPTPSKEGYTFQGWNSKNLLNYNNIIQGAQATGITVDSNGNISDSSATSDNRGWDNLSQLNWRQYLSAGTYTLRMIFSTKATSSAAQTYGQYRISKILNDAISQQIEYATTYNVNTITKTFTLTDGAEIGITVKAYDGIYKIQLEKGNTATEWEPYYLSSTTPVTQNKNHTLTAIWTPNTYTVTFNANGGTVSPSTKTVSYGEKYGDLPRPFKSGYAFKGWTELPNDYQQLEYIESKKGGQYINTNYFPVAATKIKIEFELVSTDYSSDPIPLIGERISASSNSKFVIWMNKTSKKIAINYGNYDSGYRDNTNITRKNITSNDYGNLYYNGNIVASTGVPTFETSTIPMYVFGINTSESGYLDHRTQQTRVYSLKIYEGNTIKRDFIPCYKISTGKAGLYDLVNNVFYPNSNTSVADFTRGEKKYITSETAVKKASNHTLYAVWEAF